MEQIDIATISAQVTEMATEYLPKAAMAIVALIVGFWVVGKIVKLLRAALLRGGVELSLARFMTSLADVGMKVMLLLSVAEMFGFETTSFVAIFGALMVGVGMALNGNIGHLASGVMLMIFKPFKVGDMVEIGGGETGIVEAINAFNTTLSTPENKKIYISNSNVTSNTITNMTGSGLVGVTLTFGIGYNDDIDKAREIILAVGEQCPHTLEDPPQGVVVTELADSSVNLGTRPFCKSEFYWDTKFFMLENVKKEFDKAGIGIPYPQLDVHMIK